MKRFVVYFSNELPLPIYATTYERDGDFIKFLLGNIVVKTIRAEGVLTIVADKNDAEKEA